MKVTIPLIAEFLTFLFQSLKRIASFYRDEPNKNEVFLSGIYPLFSDYLHFLGPVVAAQNIVQVPKK